MFKHNYLQQLLLKAKSASPADLLAGLSVASLLLPEAVAYAAIAHLPVQQALTAILVGLCTYALLGGSPYAIVAPTSSAAALMAAVVISLNPQSNHSAGELGAALLMLTGLGLLAVAKVGLGRLSAFISRPVLHGFSFALALTIIIKQLPALFGINVHAPDLLTLVIALSRNMSTGSYWNAAIGGGSLVLLWQLKRWPMLPGAFLVLAIGIALSTLFDFQQLHVATIGNLQLSTPSLTLPHLALDKWLQIAELACGLLVIIVAESWGSIRSISLAHANAVEPNRELFALGTANLLAGFCQGMPVGAGFSASNANEQAGARSKWAGLAAAGFILGISLWGQTLIARIPEPMVAAAVIHALSHALNPKAIIQLWRMNRDQYLALAAIFAVLAFGVLHGMLIGVALSLAATIRSFSQPLVKELGQLPQTRDYVVRDNHPSALPQPELLLLRPEEPLFFANVEGVVTDIERRFKASQAKILIISLEQSTDLDSTATECLLELQASLKQQGKPLLLARVKDPIRALLMVLAQPAFASGLFWSVDDAVNHAQIQLKTLKSS